MKKGMDYMTTMPVIIIISLIIFGLLAYFSGETLFGVFKAQGKFAGEKCPGKTQRDFQKDVINAIKDDNYDTAIQKHKQFTNCFSGKDLKFSDEQMYNFGVAAKNSGSMQLAEYLFDRYRDEFPNGENINDVQTMLDDIYS